MNHLIFGGSGFIGTHLNFFLLKSAIDVNTIYNYDIIKKCNGNFGTVDVRMPIEIDNNDYSNSIIYNLAAVHTTPGHSDHEYFETNIVGAQNICNFASKNNIDSIVFTSSVAIYGPSEEFKREDFITMPTTPYGISKLTAEYIHKLWQLEEPERRKLVILRPGAVFGKNEGGNFSRLYRILKRGMFFYPGRKDTIKAAVYVKDVARILYETGQQAQIGVLTLNITLEPAPTIEAICQTMAKLTNVSPPKFLMPAWMLVNVSRTLYFFARLFGKRISGIHPNQVRKLMVSTNVSGKILSNSRWKLQYTLEEAFRDWYEECGERELC